MSTPGRPPLPLAPRRDAALSVGRATLTVAALVLVYYLLPLTQESAAVTGLALVGGLIGLGVLLVWQLQAIVRAPYPGLRAFETLALAIPAFLLLFAAVYVLASDSDPASFTEPLTRTDAIYFAVTVFATVGFGDIAALAQSTRIVVTLQMVGDLLVIGLVLRAVLDAVERGRQRRVRGPETGS
ncbi:potassium channel family protein [Actinomycetospora sp. C-140]